jgi:four helix bundle protein
MARDYRTFDIFHDCDELVLAVYEVTATMPAEERYGLQSQIRRAAVSVPANIVEGSTRWSDSDYCNFLIVARGSARECEYLLSLAKRLRFIAPEQSDGLGKRYSTVQAGLLAAIRRSRTTNATDDDCPSLRSSPSSPSFLSFPSSLSSLQFPEFPQSPSYAALLTSFSTCPSRI